MKVEDSYPYRLGYLQSAVECATSELLGTIGRLVADPPHGSPEFVQLAVREDLEAVLDRLESALAVSNRDHRG